MICYAMQLAHFPIAMLEHGARMEELQVRPECQFSPWTLRTLRSGMDASINDMLTGGQGFPAVILDPQAELIFDMGCKQEQRDLRSLSNAR